MRKFEYIAIIVTPTSESHRPQRRWKGLIEWNEKERKKERKKRRTANIQIQRRQQKYRTESTKYKYLCILSLKSNAFSPNYCILRFWYVRLHLHLNAYKSFSMTDTIPIAQCSHSLHRCILSFGQRFSFSASFSSLPSCLRSPPRAFTKLCAETELMSPPSLSLSLSMLELPYKIGVQWVRAVQRERNRSPVPCVYVSAENIISS